MNKKLYIRIWIVVVIICMMWFSDWTFADNESLSSAVNILDWLLAVLSWWWVVCAKLAWIFLTNSWVYWETLWLDSLLWQYWVLVRNIANFWLWFYFVYIIFEALISKEETIKRVKDIILWILIAWVWIQSSRFLVAATIDVSTITLVAAWSLPSQVIAENPLGTETLEASVGAFLDKSGVLKWKQFSLFPDGEAGEYFKEIGITLESQPNREQVLEWFMPKPTDVGWPLYFLWISIIKPWVLVSINTDTSDDEKIKSNLLNIIIQWWSMIVFGIEMLVLCVLAFMRIIYLWMFIVLSPLAVLIWCIGKSSQKKSWSNKWFLSGFTKQINFKSFFLNAFKPTIIVLWMGLAVIFCSLMGKIIVDKESSASSFDIWWVKYDSMKNPLENGQNAWDQTYTTTVDTGILSFTLANAWKTLLQLILSIVTVVIVYLIIKVAVQMWGWDDFVSKSINRVQETVSSAMTSIPIMPVAWYDEKTWEKKTRRISAWSVLGVGGKESLWNRFLANVNYGQKQQMNKQVDDVVSSLFPSGGNWWTWLTNEQKWKIENAINNSPKWISQLKEVKQRITWINLAGQTSDSRYWMKQFGQWLTNMNSYKDNIQWTTYQSVWRDMIVWWNDDNVKKEEKTIQNLFERNQGSVRAYAEVFGLWDITEWNQLMDKNI